MDVLDIQDAVFRISDKLPKNDFENLNKVCRAIGMMFAEL